MLMKFIYAERRLLAKGLISRCGITYPGFKRLLNLARYRYLSDDVNKKLSKDESEINKAQHHTHHTLSDNLNSARNAASAIGTATSQIYEDVEKLILLRVLRLNESNQRRFRYILFSTLILILCASYAFGGKIKKSITDQTADIAKETLENESLKIQTQELAMAVVQTILNDKDITSHAASFLREASTVPETQQALLQLTLHVLNHPDSLAEVSTLLKNVIQVLSKDQETIENLTNLLMISLKDPRLKAACISLIEELVRDPEFVNIIVNTTVEILAKKEVIDATTNLLGTSAQAALADEEVVSKSRDFVADVMADAKIQKEGGDAIWNSVTHALKPGVLRVAGFGLLCASIALVRIIISPF